MLLLTDKQWKKVGTVISANPGMKEIVVSKDVLGNAEVDFHGHRNYVHKRLQGNVVQFPTDHMVPPEPNRFERVLDKIEDWLQEAYIQIGIDLGFLDDDLRDGVDNHVSGY